VTGTAAPRLTIRPIRGSVRLRALRDALVVLGLGILAFWFLVLAPEHRDVGRDAYAYWSVDQANPYALAEGSTGAFTYPPPMVRLFAPLALLSWPAFLWLWLGLQVGTVAWLGWTRTLLVLAFPPVAVELYYGNVNLLLAAAVALGFRYPAAWAFVLLTKVTPGVGLIWFAVRREWRSLAVALGATAAIVAVSVAIDAPLWGDWLAVIRQGTISEAGILASSIWLRLVAAAILAAWGARTDRRWTVPVAVTLGMPVLFPATLCVLLAVLTLDRPQLRPRGEVGSGAPGAAAAAP
jgi:hypothetical protein